MISIVSLSSQFSLERSRGLMRTASESEIFGVRLLTVKVNVRNSPFFVGTLSKNKRRDSARTVVTPASLQLPKSTVTR